MHPVRLSWPRGRHPLVPFGRFAGALRTAKPKGRLFGMSIAHSQNRRPLCGPTQTAEPRLRSSGHALLRGRPFRIDIPAAPKCRDRRVIDNPVETPYHVRDAQDWDARHKRLHAPEGTLVDENVVPIFKSGSGLPGGRAAQLGFRQSRSAAPPRIVRS